MIKEVEEAKKYFAKNYNGIVGPGTYSVPTITSKGKAFMRVNVDERGFLSDFDLFTDHELTKSWYEEKKTLLERCADLFRSKKSAKGVDEKRINEIS